MKFFMARGLKYKREVLLRWLLRKSGKSKVKANTLSEAIVEALIGLVILGNNLPYLLVVVFWLYLANGMGYEDWGTEKFNDELGLILSVFQ